MNHRVSVRSFALLLSLAVLGGCSDDDTPAPSGTPAGSAGTPSAGSGGTATGGSGGTATGGSGGTATGGSGGTATGGSGGAATAGSGGSGQSGTVSKDIKAAEGGTVTAGEATIEIPPGALAQDTTITVNVGDPAGQPDAENIASKVYDFGPDGTQFQKPAKMSIALDPSKVPAGKKATIAYLDAGKWVPLADSVVQGAQITATTTHFTPFVILIQFDGSTADKCASLNFSACGGDPTGVWTYDSGCVDLDNPFASFCPTATFAITLDISGTLTLDAAKMFKFDWMASSSSKVEIPKSCVGNDCASLDKENPYTDTGSTCVKDETETPKTTNDSGNWSASGTVLTFTDGMGGIKNSNYCVEGSTLTLQIPSDDGKSTVYYRMTK